MAIDTSLIQDTDWLACTDDDGITYKVSGAAFKGLFIEPAGISGTIVIPTDGFEFYLSATGTSIDGLKRTIDWGDGNIETFDDYNFDFTHTYTSAGTYEISLRSNGSSVPVGNNDAKVKPSLQCWTKYGPPDSGFVLPTQAFKLNFNMQSVDATYLADFDFSVATDISQAWSHCGGITTAFPFIDTSNVTAQGFFQSWVYCENMIGPFPLIDTSKGTDFTYTWLGCTQLSGAFPLIDLSNATTLLAAWSDCENITSFPEFDLGSISPYGLTTTWLNCSSLQSFPEIDTGRVETFNSTWSKCSGLTSFPLLDVSSGTEFSNTWQDCSNLTGFPLMNFSSAEKLQSTWYACSGLTSFPLIDTSNVTSFYSTWNYNNNLTSFPALDTSKGENFQDAWNTCQKIASFPVIDVSNGTNFIRTWKGLQQLSAFPALTFNSGTSFFECWNQCYQLTDFPPNAFDVTGTLDSNAFQYAFGGGQLSVASVQNILVSLDTNGQSNVFLTLYGAGKSTWTTAANTAYDNLIVKGWTIDYSA